MVVLRLVRTILFWAENDRALVKRSAKVSIGGGVWGLGFKV